MLILEDPGGEPLDRLLGEPMEFDRVMANGTLELVLVSGYSGIGKSSVVNELHRVLVPPCGLFASGKFDQYKRNIPYAILVHLPEHLSARFCIIDNTTAVVFVKDLYLRYLLVTANMSVAIVFDATKSAAKPTSIFRPVMSPRRFVTMTGK